MADDDIPVFIDSPIADDLLDGTGEPIPSFNWMDVDAAMWSGYTPTPPVDDPPYPFAGQQPEVGGQREPPPSYPAPPSLVLQGIQAPWQEATVWSLPYDVTQTVCVPWYEIDHVIFTATAPDTRMIVIQSISYEFEQSVVANGDIFEIRVLRGGVEMARWEEYVADNAQANPAHRYAFAGHNGPDMIPIKFRLDGVNQESITVTVRPRGAYPFVRTPADPFNGSVTVNVRGYMTRLRDRREGAPKYLTNGVVERFDPDLKQTIADAARIYQELKGS